MIWIYLEYKNICICNPWWIVTDILLCYVFNMDSKVNFFRMQDRMFGQLEIRLCLQI